MSSVFTLYYMGALLNCLQNTLSLIIGLRIIITFKQMSMKYEVRCNESIFDVKEEACPKRVIQLSIL